jgi:uncharacterized protein
MSQENVEIVRRLHPGSDTDLVALSRDSAAWRAVAESVSGLFEPDFELEFFGGLPGLSATYRGVSGLRDAWLDWLAPWETYHDELQEALDLGDRVLLLGRHRGTRETTSPEVSAAFAALYTLRNGKVCRVQYFADQAEALKAVGLEE